MNNFIESHNFIDSSREVLSYLGNGPYSKNDLIYYFNVMGHDPTSKELKILYDLIGMNEDDLLTFNDCIDMLNAYKSDPEKYIMKRIKTIEEYKDLNEFKPKSNESGDIIKDIHVDNIPDDSCNISNNDQSVSDTNNDNNSSNHENKIRILREEIATTEADRIKKKSPKEIAVLYRSHYDHQGKGMIPKDIFIKSLTESPISKERLTREEVESLLESLKMNSLDEIDYNLFIKTIYNIDKSYS